MTVRQKLGMILENKVVQKLKLENNVFFCKKQSHKLIFLNEKKKIPSIFDFDFESTILGLFGKLSFMDRYFEKKSPFSVLILGQKSCF
jgi:predicted alpha/beta-fold hydrolase